MKQKLRQLRLLALFFENFQQHFKCKKIELLIMKTAELN
jgi:hypothetical protein